MQHVTIPHYLIIVGELSRDLQCLRVSYRFAIRRIRETPTFQKCYHCGHHAAECCCVGAVFVEGHGIESTTAGILLGVLLVGLMFREN